LTPRCCRRVGGLRWPLAWGKPTRGWVEGGGLESRPGLSLGVVVGGLGGVYLADVDAGRAGESTQGAPVKFHDVCLERVVETSPSVT